VAPSIPSPEPEEPVVPETVDRTWIRAGMALTILFPLIVLGIIWSEFYEIPYVAMVLSIAPALTIPLRFNSDILLIACAIDVILVVFGIIAGFFNDLFFTLAEVVIVDIVAMAIMFVLAAMYPGRVKS